ncbi:MAG: hypothetical protein ACQESR_14965, partial [Planctomycetota bacterium]
SLWCPLVDLQRVHQGRATNTGQPGCSALCNIRLCHPPTLADYPLALSTAIEHDIHAILSLSLSGLAPQWAKHD